MCTINTAASMLPETSRSSHSLMIFSVLAVREDGGHCIGAALEAVANILCSHKNLIGKQGDDVVANKAKKINELRQIGSTSTRYQVLVGPTVDLSRLQNIRLHCTRTEYEFVRRTARKPPAMVLVLCTTPGT